MAARLLQNGRDMRRIIHPSTLRRTLLLCNDGIRPTANFQFVAFRVLEKERVVTRAVVDANLGPFQIFAAGLSHQFGDLVHFFPGLGPERNPRPVWSMVFVFGETKELRRPIAARGVESMEIFALTLWGCRFVFLP